MERLVVQLQPVANERVLRSRSKRRRLQIARGVVWHGLPASVRTGKVFADACAIADIAGIEHATVAALAVTVNHRARDAALVVGGGDQSSGRAARGACGRIVNLAIASRLIVAIRPGEGLGTVARGSSIAVLIESGAACADARV